MIFRGFTFICSKSNRRFSRRCRDFFEKIYAKVVSEFGRDASEQNLKDAFGGRARLLTSGGAPLPDEIAAFFADRNLPILQAYGLTKNICVAFNTVENIRFGTVGKPMPMCDVRFAEDGEILVKSPMMFSGYYKVPEKTAEMFDENGWLKYRVGTYTDFLDKFMSELKIEKASLVGNSLGGWIAADFALKYPAKAEKIVLVDAAGIKPDDVNFRQIYALNFSTRDEVRQLVKLVFYNQAIFGSEAFIEESLRLRIAAGDGYTINSLIDSIKRDEDFFNDRLGGIKQPTLIIWGKQDGLLPLADGEKFDREIPNSDLVVFDKCGHVLQVEKGTDFNKAVLEFLSR